MNHLRITVIKQGDAFVAQRQMIVKDALPETGTVFSVEGPADSLWEIKQLFVEAREKARQLGIAHVENLDTS